MGCLYKWANVSHNMSVTLIWRPCLSLLNFEFLKIYCLVCFLFDFATFLNSRTFHFFSFFSERNFASVI